MKVHRLARWAVAMVAAVSVGSAGMAAAKGPGGVKPGKGCGDRNHVHYKEASCKKKPKHKRH